MGRLYKLLYHHAAFNTPCSCLYVAKLTFSICQFPTYSNIFRMLVPLLKNTSSTDQYAFDDFCKEIETFHKTKVG